MTLLEYRSSTSTDLLQSPLSQSKAVTRDGLARSLPCGHAFTLIEVMIAVLIMALLASAAALSLSVSLKTARAAEMVDQLRSFDQAARSTAKQTKSECRIAFDLSNNTLARRVGIGLRESVSRMSPPMGYQFPELRVSGQVYTDGEAVVDCSALGISRSYAVHVKGPGLDSWLLFAGLTGEMTQVSDESAAQSILDRAAPIAYRSWEATKRDDAD